jgi:hypothetical protein
MPVTAKYCEICPWTKNPHGPILLRIIRQRESVSRKPPTDYSATPDLYDELVATFLKLGRKRDKVTKKEMGESPSTPCCGPESLNRSL